MRLLWLQPQLGRDVGGARPRHLGRKRGENSRRRQLGLNDEQQQQQAEDVASDVTEEKVVKAEFRLIKRNSKRRSHEFKPKREGR